MYVNTYTLNTIRRSDSLLMNIYRYTLINYYDFNVSRFFGKN